MSVEANFLEKWARIRTERRVTIREEFVASTSDPKIDNLVRTMERIILNERFIPR